MNTTETSRSQELVAVVRSDQFVEQLGLALPETVSPRRFARIAVTAIQQNPDLARCERDTIAQALLRCAADGLLPDGREAALVKYGDKAAYIPMIGGFRKIAADHGWTLRTRVVHENDTFDYTEEPPTLVHTPTRPGLERGPLVACYAIATHADGRRLQRILHAVDVDKRKASARSKNVWEQWPEQMWEKTAGRDLFGELPLGDLDGDRVQRIIAADAAFDRAVVDPVAALYGVEENGGSADSSDRAAENGGAEPNVRAGDDGAAEAGGGGGVAARTGSPSVPAADVEEPVEEGEWSEAVDEPETAPELSAEVVKAAGEQKVPGGVHFDNGRSLADVAKLGDQGLTWLLTQLKRLPADDRMRPAIETYVRGQLPETWAKYEAWLQEQS
jgi:recombination protein RecT